ncbi:extracellular solute-binding protein [Paenibacillus sp. CC-CFT747]|nr:extracellular solute-binding protein [Paenibacillus sp. CC-CFT747]
MSHKIVRSTLVLGLAFSTIVGCTPAKENESATGGESAGPQAGKKAEKVYVYANFGNLGNTSVTTKPEALQEVQAYIKEKTGIEVIPIIPPKGSEADKLNILLGSNEPLDIFSGTMATHQLKGAARPLNDLLDKYGPNVKKLWPADWKASWDALTTQDGKIWAIPAVPPVAGNTVLVREDWLKKLNLPMPKTIDEMENVLKELKDKDPAGNGQTIPLLTDLPGLYGSLAAGYMNVGYGNWVDKDGKVKPPQLNPGFKDFLAKMADWYKKGYLYKEAFSTDRTRQIELVKQNRVAVGALWNTTITANEYLLRQNIPEAKYTVAADLQGPLGNVTTIGGVGTGGIMINKNAQNAEAAMKYINWVQSDLENYLTVFFGIQGKHWKYVNKEKHIIEAINTDYMGELVPGLSFAYTVQFQKNDPSFGPQFDYIQNYITNRKRVKPAGTAEVDYRFDAKTLQQNIPTSGDISRMMDQEIIKFITGARPLSDYDKFVEELNKAGLDKWIETYTAEYNRVKGK